MTVQVYFFFPMSSDFCISYVNAIQGWFIYYNFHGCSIRMQDSKSFKTRIWYPSVHTINLIRVYQLLGTPKFNSPPTSIQLMITFEWNRLDYLRFYWPLKKFKPFRLQIGPNSKLSRKEYWNWPCYNYWTINWILTVCTLGRNAKADPLLIWSNLKTQLGYQWTNLH